MNSIVKNTGNNKQMHLLRMWLYMWIGDSSLFHKKICWEHWFVCVCILLWVFVWYNH